MNNDPIQLLLEVHKYLNSRRATPDDEAKRLRLACEPFLQAFDPTLPGGHAVVRRDSANRLLTAYNRLDSLGKIVACPCEEYPDAALCGDHRRDEDAKADLIRDLAWRPVP